MRYETIHRADEDGLTILTLNRRETRNALNVRMRAELLHAFREAPKTARCIAITGAGEALCSGQALGDGATGTRARTWRSPRTSALPPSARSSSRPSPGSG